MASTDAAKGFVSTLSMVVKTYHVFEERLDQLAKDVERLASRVADLERRDAEMAERLARLEESRSTLKAEVGQEISQVIADIRVRFAEQEAQRTLTLERAL